VPVTSKHVRLQLNKTRDTNACDDVACTINQSLTAGVARAADVAVAEPPRHVYDGRQGLTLVHFPAQRKRLLWDREYMTGLIRGCLGGMKG